MLRNPAKLSALPRMRRRPNMNAIPAQKTTLEIANPSPTSGTTEVAVVSISGDDADTDCGAEPRRTTAAVLTSCAHAAPEGRLAFAGSIVSGAAPLLLLLLNTVCPRWQQDATNCQPSSGNCAQRFDTILKEVDLR